MKNASKLALLALSLCLASALAASYPRVDGDLRVYDQTIQKMKTEFAKHPRRLKSKKWLKRKLQHMVDIDQYTRSYWRVPHKNKYSNAEKEYFRNQFLPRSNGIDRRNAEDLKKLLRYRDWFRISEFGITADEQAWLLVQHADHDVPLQKRILPVLEMLYPIQETKPAHYAYLYDRIASSPGDVSKRTPQRFGTQGRCVARGTWEPWPIEDEDRVDERRASMGMTTMAEYKAMFKDVCP